MIRHHLHAQNHEHFEYTPNLSHQTVRLRKRVNTHRTLTTSPVGTCFITITTLEPRMFVSEVARGAEFPKALCTENDATQTHANDACTILTIVRHILTTTLSRNEYKLKIQPSTCSMIYGNIYALKRADFQSHLTHPCWVSRRGGSR